MNAWLLSVVLSVCSNLINAEAEKEFKIPSYVDLCYRDDPKVADCIKKDIEKLLPIFKNGSKEFDLEAIDPMYFDVLEFNYNSGILGGNLSIYDCYIHGLSGSKVKEVRPKVNEPKKFQLDFDVHVPVMNLKANYKLKGNVIKIPVNMKGRIDVLFDSINVTYHIDGEVKTIDEYDYLIINKFTWKFFAEGINKVTLQNKDVVDGKPALNRMVRTVVNSNWRPLVKQMLPVILPESDKRLKSMFSKFFKSYPYDIIFPKRTRSKDITGLNNDKTEDATNKEVETNA